MPSRMIATGIALVAMLAACSSAAPAGSTPTAAAPSSSASGTPAAVTAAPATGPGAGELDACALITVAEAAAATGVAVARADGAGGACIYYGEADAMVLGLGTEVGQIGVAAINMGYLDDPANELVPSIGDKAVIYQHGDFAGRAIYVRKGTTAFHLDVDDTDIDLAHARTILIQLATMVAGRI